MTKNPVTLAAQRLDTLVPNWAKEVDPTKVNLHSPYSCVLGQIAASARGKALIKQYAAMNFEVRSSMHIYGYCFGTMFNIAKLTMTQEMTSAFFPRVIWDEKQKAYTTFLDQWKTEIALRTNSPESKLADLIAYRAKVEPELSDAEIEATVTEWATGPVRELVAV